MWIQFAREHVQLGEIDTPYVFAAHCEAVKGEEWLRRMLLYYFLYYDLEGAVKCAESCHPWSYIFGVYNTAKRGKARRHFRGANGMNALIKLRELGGPRQVFGSLYRPTYTELVNHIQTNYQGCQIGPYFQWKLMDIFDRCLGYPVSLSMEEALKYLPETPRKGAREVFPDMHLASALDAVVKVIDDIPAPGQPTRMCGLPEAETILCAMYGRRKGTYQVGDDIRSRHEQLKDFPDLIKLLPPLQDWSKYNYAI